MCHIVPKRKETAFVWVTPYYHSCIDQDILVIKQPVPSIRSLWSSKHLWKEMSKLLPKSKNRMPLVLHVSIENVG